MKRLLFIFSFFLFFSAEAFSRTPPVTVDLVPQKSGIFPEEKMYLALRLKPQRGWHLYWRNSGDAGEPVDFRLSLPEGFEQTEVLWPYPERFSDEGMAEYGYGKDAVLLIGIKAPDYLPSGKKLEIKSDVIWMACKNECVPGASEAKAYLTSGMKDDYENPLIRDALAFMPQKEETPVPFWEKGDVLILGLPASLEALEKAYFFPYSAKVVDHAAEQYIKMTQGKAYLFLKGRSERDKPLEDTFSGTLVTHGRDGAAQAFDITANRAKEVAPEFPLAFRWLDFAGALILAFAGGFLLNLMPCVFPVLSLKAFKVVSSAKSNARQIEKESLFYTAGVLVSFLSVGGALLAFRAAGTELGWGFQLQYPPFVLFLSVFMFVLGLLFSDAASFGETISSKSAAVSSGCGDFGTGVLAVVVATPCAAPFMGTALGYGLLSPAPVTLAVFAFMGTGMALPFLMLGFFPAFARMLPKPGAWMVLFRKFLAFPLYGASGWLLWVLAAQGGSFALATGIVCLVFAGFSVWLCGEAAKAPKLKIWGRGALVCFILLTAVSLYSVSPDVQTKEDVLKTSWLPYQPEKIEEYRNKNVPVFIKFSADWCLTCLLNDKAVLNTPKAAELFRSKGVAVFYADWTERDDGITRALESFERGGVPLYVYYAPHARDPKIFPQILTYGILEDAFEEL